MCSWLNQCHKHTIAALCMSKWWQDGLSLVSHGRWLAYLHWRVFFRGNYAVTIQVWDILISDRLLPAKQTFTCTCTVYVSINSVYVLLAAAPSIVLMKMTEKLPRSWWDMQCIKILIFLCSVIFFPFNLLRDNLMLKIKKKN